MENEITNSQIIDGDKKAFEKIFREYYEGLLRFIWGYVNSEAVAEELVQELFLRIWKNRTSIEITESLHSYLFRSARNVSIDYLRHEEIERTWASEKKALYDPGDIPGIDDQLNDKILLEDVKRVIQDLPERRREIFMLSRYEQMSYREIAKTLDISVNTVETQMSRSLKTLREHFEPYLI